jgi:type I restriction enzyme S subunit
MVKLGEVCTIRKGTKVEQIEQSTGAIRFIQIDDLRNDKNIKYCKLNKKYVLVNPNDIIVAWDGANAGTIGFGLNGAIGSTLARIRLENDKLDTEFVGLLLRSKYAYLRSNCTGATIPHINRKSLVDIKIPLLPLETQKHIAKTLDTAAELIALRKTQLAELDNLAKSIFYEMFGDPVTNEKGWNIRKIIEIARVETGSTPKRSNVSYYSNGLIPWIKTGEISSGYILSAEEHISELALKETNCKLLPNDTILVAMYGQGKTRGQVGMLKIEAATNQACAAILPSENYVPDFLYQLLREMYEDLRELGRGGNQPNLNLSIIKNFKVILPPLELQNQFATIVAKIEEQKTLVQKALDESQYLFDSLMSKFFE